jgi:hypothetical protein
MKDTGERMVPEYAANSHFWEHVYRYHFALPYARNENCWILPAARVMEPQLCLKEEQRMLLVLIWIRRPARMHIVNLELTQWQQVPWIYRCRMPPWPGILTTF